MSLSWIKKLKYFLKNVLLGIVIAIVFLLIIELIIRIFLPFPLTSITTYQADKEVMYFHKPNSVGYEMSLVKEFSPKKLEYNKYGFRGDWDDFPDNKERVFLVGDSFVEARQVEFENTISEILNRNLKDKFFINSGCSAYTTTTEYLLFKYKILKLHPKHIYLFFAFNDYADNYWYKGGYYKQKDIFEKLPDKKFLPNDYKAYFKSLDNVLFTNIALYAYYKYLLKPPYKIQLWKEVANSKFFYSSPKLINKPTNNMDKLEREILNFTHKGVLKIANLAKKNGIKFTFVILPNPVQVNKDEWKIGKTIFGYDKDYMDNSRVYQDRLLKLCKENNLNCIDVLPTFQEKSEDGHRMFLPFDGHMTKYGQKTVANLIKKDILK